MPFRYAELASPITDVSFNRVHRRGSEVIFDDSYSMPNSHRLRLAWIFRKSYSLRHCLSDLFYSLLFYYKNDVLSRGRGAVFGKTAVVFENLGGSFEVHISEEVDFSNNAPTVTPKTSAMA